MTARFNHTDIEHEAQEKWAKLGQYTTDLNDESKEPYYLLFEFPYPSGDLHIGHWYAYAITDIYARMMRMRGKNVLFPIGFDAFGLPAENAAIKRGANPATWTLENIEKMRAQIRSIGTSVDWSKEVVTCDPEYYRWTQWLFAQFLESGLAYRKEASVKWCPKDCTVLANEQVIDGRCERCDSEVEEKTLTQWFMKITEYAEPLLIGLETLPWREEIKEAQRQWIGKSEGAKIWFSVSGSDTKIEVFTTRPDTIFGATYVVLAPEHPLVTTLAYTNKADVQSYIRATKKKTERERSENKKKSGVVLEGVMAINPATKEEIPVYIADYVLASYGTGAVMAVPAHDERDFAFAQRYSLPIREVIAEQITPRREDAVFRRIAIAIIENNNGEVLIQSTKRDSTETFGLPGGGVDEGEDIQEAARREVIEETGYTDLELIDSLGTTETTYFNPVRDIYRHALATCYVYKLKSDTQQGPTLSDLEKKSVITHAWYTKEDAAELLRGSSANSGEDDPFFTRYLKKTSLFHSNDGVLINSGEYTNRNNREVFNDIVQFVGGELTTNYRMRDWLVSRQRYWGCPIPIVYSPEGKPQYVGDENLPWLLPTDVDFSPTGEASGSPTGGKAPLASSKELHERVEKLFGKGWTPEYDTLDTFVDSSWYFMRYLAPHDETQFSDMELMKQWLPVDRYSGGSEHTTMHLLYARFFQKALHTLRLVPNDEPFTERFNRGIILGSDGQKMSKRWGNVINPDEVVKEYGADAVRMYLAFIGPYNEAGHYPWNLDGVQSMRKLLGRVLALKEYVGASTTEKEERRLLAEAENKVRTDSDKFKFNTALSALMVLTNGLEKLETISTETYDAYIQLWAPFAPHLTEHIWGLCGHIESIHTTEMPTFDKALLEEDSRIVVIQVNGKRRTELSVPTDTAEEDVLRLALAIDSVAKEVGASSAKHIYVPGRILNFIVPK